jgi:hypothetical protein
MLNLIALRQLAAADIKEPVPKRSRLLHISSWVLLSPTTNPPYTPLPNERTLLIAPPRIGLSLSTPSHYPAKQQQPFSLAHPLGTLYLTNQRIVYLPDKATDKLKSFAAPLVNLHDSHVTAPFFGPNVWTASLQPVQGGGIPTPSGGVVELKLTFKDGGAYDFHTKYEQVRERLQQALEVARLNGEQASNSRGGALNGVDISNVNLEELPAYQEESDGPLLPPTHAAVVNSQNVVSPVLQQQGDSGDDAQDTRAQPRATDSTFSPPDEPPPAYEDYQAGGQGRS